MQRVLQKTTCLPDGLQSLRFPGHLFSSDGLAGVLGGRTVTVSVPRSGFNQDLPNGTKETP
jgi:hypothetical protein